MNPLKAALRRLGLDVVRFPSRERVPARRARAGQPFKKDYAVDY